MKFSRRGFFSALIASAIAPAIPRLPNGAALPVNGIHRHNDWDMTWDYGSECPDGWHPLPSFTRTIYWEPNASFHGFAWLLSQDGKSQ